MKDNYFNSIISARLGSWLEKKEEIGKEGLYEDLRFLFAYRNHYTYNLSLAKRYLFCENKNRSRGSVEESSEELRIKR